MNRDPGLQGERTALAWTRTSLVMAVNATPVLRAGMQADDAGLIGLGVILALIALGVFMAGAHRRQQLAARPSAPADAVMRWTAASVILAAMAGAWTLLRAPLPSVP